MVYQKISKSASSNPKSPEKYKSIPPKSIPSSPTPIAHFHNFTQIPVHSPDRQPIQAKLQANMIGNRQDSSMPQTSNLTGLPDQLKTGIENLSGYSMDAVRVHYDSEKPAQFQAHAYTQGRDIHVASGQEKHLPHEAWHVVQQMKGRVQPTILLKGNVPVNDETSLEVEADVMGAKAAQLQDSQPEVLQHFQYRPLSIVQRVKISGQTQSSYLLASKMGDDRYPEKLAIIKGLGDENFDTITDLQTRINDLLPDKGVFLDGKAIHIIGVGTRYNEHIHFNKSVKYIRECIGEIKVGKEKSIKVGEGRKTGYAKNGQILYNYDGSTIEIYHAHDEGKMG